MTNPAFAEGPGKADVSDVRLGGLIDENERRAGLRACDTAFPA